MALRERQADENKIWNIQTQVTSAFVSAPLPAACYFICLSILASEPVTRANSSSEVQGCEERKSAKVPRSPEVQKSEAPLDLQQSAIL